MNIFWHELRMYRRSMLTWIASLAAAVLVFFSIYPAFHNEVATVSQILGAFPELVRDALGIPLDMIGSILGYYSFIINYIVLCGAIQAMNIGTLLLAKEISGKTVDFILTKPVARVRVVAFKLLAGLAILLLTNAAYLGVTSAAALLLAPEPFDYRLFLLMSLTLLLVQLVFFAFGFLASTMLRKIKSVLPLTLSVVFGFFIMALFSSAIKDDALRYLTPFRYFDAIYIINNARYELPFLLIDFALVAAAIAAGTLIYRKRDIHAA